MDRESYEAGFRAAQQQSLQPQPQEGNDFLGALGKSAAGIGIAVGAGLAGRRLMRGRGAAPEISKRDQVETNARTAATELSKRTGSLQTGVKLPSASEVAQGTVPTVEQRRATYAAVAAKPESELPPVKRPQSGADVELIRENTGELRQAGKSPADYDDAADRFLRKYEGDYKQAVQRQEAGEIGRESQRQTQVVAKDILSELKEEAGGNFANQYLVDQQYVDAPDVGARLKKQGIGMAGMPGDGPLEIDDGTRRFVLGSPNADAALKKAGVTSEQAESYWTNKLKSQGLLDDVGTSTETQAARRPLVVEQSAEASDTAVDQMAGRIDRNIQRDIDVNLTEFQAIDSAATDRGANPVVAAQTAAKAVDSDFAGTQTDAPIQGPISAQATADAALAEMKARRAEVAATGLQPGTVRFERALAQPFRTSANVKPQMTGESMAKTTLPAGPIRQSVQGVGAIEFETIPERTVPNIGPEAVVTKTAQGTAIRGASPVLEQAPQVTRQRSVFGTADTNVPGAPDEMMPDRPGRETALSQIETQPQPRIDSYAVNQEEGGGPAGIGVYGVEPSYVPGAQSKSTGLMSAASERKPTEVRQRALEKVRNPYSTLSDEELGQLSMTGSASEAYNASKQLTKRRSVDASRELQRLQKSGRPDAQQLVQQYIQDLKQG